MKQSRRFWIFFFTIFFTLGTISCSNDDPDVDDLEVPDPVEKPEQKIEYYVKYESYVSIPTSKAVSINASVTTEKGTQRLTVPRSWEGIFGPFYELTTLSISAGTSQSWNENMTSCRGRISICRGNQPFILKTDQSFKGTSFSIKYTVKEEDLK